METDRGLGEAILLMKPRSDLFGLGSIELWVESDLGLTLVHPLLSERVLLAKSGFGALLRLGQDESCSLLIGRLRLALQDPALGDKLILLLGLVDEVLRLESPRLLVDRLVLLVDGWLEVLAVGLAANCAVRDVVVVIVVAVAGEIVVSPLAEREGTEQVLGAKRRRLNVSPH